MPPASAVVGVLDRRRGPHREHRGAERPSCAVPVRPRLRGDDDAHRRLREAGGGQGEGGKGAEDAFRRAWTRRPPGIGTAAARVASCRKGYHCRLDSARIEPDPMTQMRIPAVYMRGGTSKGVFFRERDLPADPARARPRAAARDRQPRPLRQADRRHGGGDLQHEQDRDHREVRAAGLRRGLPLRAGRHRPAGRSTGRATAATSPAPSARSPISEGLVEAPRDGTAVVRIWQANVGKRIVSHVPDARRRGGGGGRLRAGRRHLPLGRDPPGVHGPGRRRR